MRELVLGLQPDKAQSSKLSYRDYGKCAKISNTSLFLLKYRDEKVLDLSRLHIYRILHECSCFIEFIKQVGEKR